jgi:hypothetical protein
MTTVLARERGLYHGWKVVIALFLAGMMVYGCGLYSFTLFITPLTAEFGWSRAATSGLVSAFCWRRRSRWRAIRSFGASAAFA